jgi:hypothetical protein
MSGPRRGPEPKVAIDPLKASIIPRLPAWLDSARRRGATCPADIIGAIVVGFGAAPPECDLEGGGLIIHYVPKGETEHKRLVLAFNELGMWIEAER